MAAKTGTKKNAEQNRHPVIEVKDFGPIAQGRVELRPLTVFAGPSNTGKSWLATLIYAMWQHGIGEKRSFNMAYEKIWDAERKKLLFPENPTTWLESIEKNVPIKFTDGEKQFLKSVIESRADMLEKEILRCLGLSSCVHLVREGATGKAAIHYYSTLGGPLGKHISKLTIGQEI